VTVLAVVTSAEEAGPLVRWGARFATAHETTLVALYVGRGTQEAEPTDVPLYGSEEEDDHPIRQAMVAAGREIEAALAPPPAPPEAGEHEAKEPAEAGEEVAEGPEPAEPGEDGAGPREPAEAGAGREEAEAPADGSPEASAGASPPVEEPPRHEDPGLGLVAIRSVSHVDRERAVREELERAGGTLLVVGKHQETQGEERDLSMQLLETAPCATIVLRGVGASGLACQKVLVPAAGGPHARVALRLSERMARRPETTVYPLYVEPEDVGEDAVEVGRRQLQRSLREAGVEATEHVQPRVVTAGSPAAGIAECATDGFDLVLVGASNRGFMQRVLFGTIPDRLLAGKEAVAVAVVRRARPLAERWAEALEERVARYFPRLAREDRVELFGRVQNGSQASVDFMTLIALSTAIASLGLIQDSGAVVIGAMLVAPLMMPMIGAGLSLVQGNRALLREAVRSILVGFFTALAIGLACGLAWRLLEPEGELTGQILSRGSPGALDLVVAFLSGLAAAYAVARPGLMGAMAGVAIAAALVPPIGSAGIALAKGQTGVGQGAALLFGTNLVAIVLGAGGAFRLIGVHPPKSKAGGGGRLWVRRVVFGLVLTAVGLFFGFVGVLVTQVAEDGGSGFAVTPPVRRAIEREVSETPGVTLVAIRRPPLGSESDLEVVVAALRRVPPDLAERLDAAAEEASGRPVVMHVVGVRWEWTESTASER